MSDTTTHTTSPDLPPCPLPDCEEGEHHYHDMDCYTVDETHDCARVARSGYHCYGPHQPGLSAPIDLPEITDEMVKRAAKTYLGAVNYADPIMRTVLDEFRAELVAGVTRWQPIEIDEIKPGMRIRATIASSDRIATYTGVAHYADRDGDWCTEDGRLLTGWADPTTCEVDPASIPDPDAELIEALAGLLDLTDPEDAREVIATVRAHDEAVMGDE